MKVSITIDVNVENSGYNNADELKDSVVDFTKDLLINGAENEEVEFTLLSVDYQDVN